MITRERPMRVLIGCKGCGNELRVAARPGARVMCPECRRTLRLPDLRRRWWRWPRRLISGTGQLIVTGLHLCYRLLVVGLATSPDPGDPWAPRYYECSSCQRRMPLHYTPKDFPCRCGAIIPKEEFNSKALGESHLGVLGVAAGAAILMVIVLAQIRPLHETWWILLALTMGGLAGYLSYRGLIRAVLRERGFPEG